MLLEEFERLTNIYPTLDLYAAIEAAYMEFDGDKAIFCKAYKANKDGMAERIQREVNTANISEKQKILDQIARRDTQIEHLKQELEREQEWKPYEDTENVQQSGYESLKHSDSTRVMTDDEAKNILYNWYGFAREKIEICHSVPVFEVNRHRRIRQVGEKERLPLYNATDWNYIRFNCGCMAYELYNDDLRPFIH